MLAVIWQKVYYWLHHPADDHLTLGVVVVCQQKKLPVEINVNNIKNLLLTVKASGNRYTTQMFSKNFFPILKLIVFFAQSKFT